MKRNQKKKSNSDDEKKKRKLLKPEQRRSANITLKATKYQRSVIQRKADDCDMTASTYLLSLAMDFQPRARLTLREAELLEEAIGFRSDIKRFFGHLKGLPQAKRKEFLGSGRNMAVWLKTLAQCANILFPFLKEIENKYPAVPRTAEEHEAYRNRCLPAPKA